jgi:2-polyprenyl-6-hydroxyphenyl methylase/3-demethylubiquinone-9 3-methyltransferase
MAIDNQWYDELGDRWWDPEGLVGPLHHINPARFGYFKGVAGDLHGVKVLEVGCGGGILAESFAREGALVTGVDLSRPSLAAARRHGASSNVRIDYANAVGESLPFLDSSFDVVVSADFLEHVSNLDSVVGECSRVLKPLGLFLYDTINRTLRSRVVAVWLFERVIRLVPKHTHDPNMFIKPAEMCEVMSSHGISNRETRGLGPREGALAALAAFLNNRHVAFAVTDDKAMSYVGYGVKAG